MSMLFFAAFFGLLLAECPRNWNMTADHRCFHAYALKENFQSALQYCKKRDGELISIHNGFDNNHVFTVAAEFRAQCNYWIGLNDFDESGVFVWTDGTLTNFQRWRKGFPNTFGGTAVYMTVDDETQTWVNTDDTNQKMCFICEKAATFTTVEKRVDSTVPLTPIPGIVTPSSYLVNDSSTFFHPSVVTTVKPFVGSTGSIHTDIPTLPTKTPISSIPIDTQTTITPILDCEDLLKAGNTVSKAYIVQGQIVYCDMDTDGGGWTYLFRRQDDHINFNQLTIADYNSTLLGDPDRTHWQPLWFMSTLTNQKVYELLVEVKGDRMKTNCDFYAYDRYALFRVYANMTANILKLPGTGNMTTPTFNMETESQWKSFRIVNLNQSNYYKLGGWWVADNVSVETNQPMYPCGEYYGYENFGFYICSGADASSCTLQYPSYFSMKIRKNRDVKNGK